MNEEDSSEPRKSNFCRTKIVQINLPNTEQINKYYQFVYAIFNQRGEKKPTNCIFLNWFFLLLNNVGEKNKKKFTDLFIKKKQIIYKKKFDLVK